VIGCSCNTATGIVGTLRPRGSVIAAGHGPTMYGPRITKDADDGEDGLPSHEGGHEAAGTFEKWGKVIKLAGIKPE
jgi:hypothetical protein